MDEEDTRHADVPRAAIASHGVRFSGDAGEYFGVWMVNVVLTVVTLGLFTPWARRRTVQYFYGHTELAGSPFEFTAPLRRMVIGFLLLAALYVAFELASRTGQTAAVLLMAVAAVLLSPWLWGSAVRFRFAHTRWRGLRLVFQAGWGEIYRASWPVFAAAALWLALGFALGAMAPSPAAPASNALPRLPAVTLPMWVLIALGVVLSLLCLVRLEYNYTGLRVRRTLIGAQAGRWKPAYRDFVRIWLASVGMFVLTAAVVVGVMALVAAVGGGLALYSGSPRRPGATAILLVVALFFGGIIALFLAGTPALAYREARLFQLVWNNVGVGDVARFRCALSTSAFVWLRVRNTVFNVLSFGIYRPFARLNEYRMKSESVTMHLRGSLDALVGQLGRQQQDGFGDAIADAIGFDIV